MYIPILSQSSFITELYVPSVEKPKSTNNFSDLAAVDRSWSDETVAGIFGVMSLSNFLPKMLCWLPDRNDSKRRSENLQWINYGVPTI